MYNTQEIAKQYADEIMREWDDDQLPRDGFELASWVREEICADDHYYDAMVGDKPLTPANVVEEAANLAAELILTRLAGR